MRVPPTFSSLLFHFVAVVVFPKPHWRRSHFGSTALIFCRVKGLNAYFRKITLELTQISSTKDEL